MTRLILLAYLSLSFASAHSAQLPDLSHLDSYSLNDTFISTDIPPPDSSLSLVGYESGESGVSGFKSFGKGLPLPAFLDIFFSQMLSSSYVLSSSVALSNEVISLDLSSFSSNNSLNLLRNVLKSMGYAIREVDGVYFVDRWGEQDDPEILRHIFVYEPSNRSSVELASFSTLFPNLHFSFGAAPAGGNSNWRDGDISFKSFTPSSPGSSDFLVARGSSADLKEFKDFLNKVDIKVPEVLLRAYVFEVRDVENRDSAVNFVLNLLGGQISGGVSSSGSGFNLNLSNIGLAVQHLTSDSRVQLLSSPVLRAASGSVSKAIIGEDVPVFESFMNENGFLQQSISYQSAGVLLNMRPRVFKESVHLNLEQELSSFVQTKVGFEGAPTKLLRSFSSDVILKNGETVLIGGLTDRQETIAKSKGFFSRSSAKSTTFSELVVMIQVEILD